MLGKHGSITPKIYYKYVQRIVFSFLERFRMKFAVVGHDTGDMTVFLQGLSLYQHIKKERV